MQDTQAFSSAGRMLTVSLLVLWFGVSGARAEPVNDEILKRLDAIEQRLDQLEAGSKAPPLETLLEGIINKKQAQSAAKETSKGDLEQEPPRFEAKLVSVKAAGKDALGRPLMAVAVKVTNASDRDTSIINAHVLIQDKAGNHLATLTWTKSRAIPGKDSVTMRGTYSDGYGDDGLQRLIEMDPALIDVTFKVFKIVFKDGEVVEYASCPFCEF